MTSQLARADREAFAELYERHHQALYRYCRSILHHDEDASDALQSTMMRGFAALQTEERDFELRPWLFRIAHNESISILRRRRDVAPVEPDEVGADTLDRALDDRSSLAELRTDLADLPERQRAALVLRELSGLSHQEIAVILDSTPQNVKQTIFVAREALHQFRAGRSMSCEPVRRAISDGDGRVLGGRRIRGHLRSCDACRAFRSEIARRPARLGALVPPMPLGAAAAVLASVLPGAAGTTATVTSATSGGLLAGIAGKAAVTAAIAATAAGGVAVGPGALPTGPHVRPPTAAAAARGATVPSAARPSASSRAVASRTASELVAQTTPVAFRAPAQADHPARATPPAAPRAGTPRPVDMPSAPPAVAAAPIGAAGPGTAPVEATPPPAQEDPPTDGARSPERRGHDQHVASDETDRSATGSHGGSGRAKGRKDGESSRSPARGHAVTDPPPTVDSPPVPEPTAEPRGDGQGQGRGQGNASDQVSSAHDAPQADANAPKDDHHGSATTQGQDRQMDRGKGTGDGGR